MCGIVGYIGSKEAQPILIEGLLKLEYRGYDSSGIACLNKSSSSPNFSTTIKRAVGKIAALEAILKNTPAQGSIGIAHTRWATHGKPTELNAHPHSAAGVTVVHNGIIENYRELRARLVAEGATFNSETDTEVITQLIASEARNTDNFELAVQKSLKQLKGAYAVAILNEKNPDKIICAALATPLVIGQGNGEYFVVSDFPAALSYTKDFYILEDGDVAVVTRSGVRITNNDGEIQHRPLKTLQWSAAMAEKAGHKHFMHKEICEQPDVIEDTLMDRLNFWQDEQQFIDGIKAEAFSSINRIVIVACGTSYHAGMVGKYYLEDFAQIPVETELASEFRYRNVAVNKQTLVIGISQSGETADTLAALKYAVSKGAHVLAVCNVMDSAIPRVCQDSLGTLYTRAGLEIGVASTKAFVTQITALQLLSLAIAHRRKTLNNEQVQGYLEHLAQLPRFIRSALNCEEAVQAIARKYKHTVHMLYLGRGILFPLALEGALKMKEISYIHAEGYAAGEMKHGPIALIDDDMPVVVLALKGPGYDKVMANLEEVKARGGKIIAIGEEGDHELKALSEEMVTVPAAHTFLAPILSAIPLQLFAYHMAIQRGTDVDQPRNLAKSVTVE